MGQRKLKDQPGIADVQDPTIFSVVDGLFRMESETLAVQKLEWISDHFVVAPEQDNTPQDNHATLCLWIGNFSVTPEEKAKGYRGNYARLAIAMIDGGKYTIKAEKIPVELARHPHKSARH